MQSSFIQEHRLQMKASFYILVAFFAATGFVSAQEKPAVKPPIIIVTDPSWDVSGQKTQFGEYPLSAEQTASATSPLSGGTYNAVVAESNGRSKIVPGSAPIWRNRTADGEGEAYQFRKTVPLGPDPIRKITLEVNCDDVARVYINQRLVSVDKRDGKLKDGYDNWFVFRSVSGFMYDRIYTYDVTDYFFTNVTNTILVEAVSLAFDGSHAYLSARIVIEFAPTPIMVAAPGKAKVAVQAKKSAVAKSAGGNNQAAVTKSVMGDDQPAFAEATAGKANKKKTVFEADSDPEFEKLHVGSILELGHLYFKADDYQLDSLSYRTLDALAAFLKRHPSLKIEVGGHTNLRPNDHFATELSTNRAQAVVHYLTDKGVSADRLNGKGYGKSQPRINAISKVADRENQRVEVKVLGK